MTEDAFGLWREIRRVDRTGSTNADLAQLAGQGEPGGLVIVAREQDAGRGRLDRHWVSAPGLGLTFSVLVRPVAPVAVWGWAPLFAGLAVVEAIEAVAGIEATVKWPNDVRVGERKLAGILAERVPPTGLVIGIGLNVDATAADLPADEATSLLIEGVDAEGRDFDTVLKAVLANLAVRLADLGTAGPDQEAIDRYLARCDTVGRDVVVHLPAGAALEGRAVGVTESGALEVVDSYGNTHAVSAGDVIHVR